MVKERLIELIDKYLSGKASNTEQQLVGEYLSRLESNENIETDSGQEIKDAMWHEIELQTTHQSGQVVQMKTFRRKWGRSIAIAASVILVIGVGILLFTNTNHKGQLSAVKNDRRTDSSTISFIRREVNSTGKEKRIQLTDGSLIVLADKSELSFRQPFVDSRDITLIGKAWFKVTKDKLKPFTVYSSDISTTALGTEFTVTAFKNTGRVLVRLYEGKIVIKVTDKTTKGDKNDVYLLPGQQFVYAGQTKKVKTFKMVRNAVPERIIDDELSSDNPAIPENTKTSYFMFNNQSLAQVLDDLAALYQVKIVYDKSDLESIYFTAKYNRSESLETILKRIGTLNNLTIAKQDGAFVISK